MSTRGEPLLTIVADTCRHDTVGGACAESNQVRYSLDKKHMRIATPISKC